MQDEGQKMTGEQINGEGTEDVQREVHCDHSFKFRILTNSAAFVALEEKEMELALEEDNGF